MKDKLSKCIKQINKIDPLGMFFIYLFGIIILFALGKYHNSIIWAILTILYIIISLLVHRIKNKSRDNQN